MNNTDAISRGLAQSAAGETVDLGDFTQYLIPDAAVEAVADEVEAHSGPLGDPDEGTLCDCGAVVAPVGEYGVRAWREHVARAALSAALPFLGTAQSATREDVAESISSTRVTGREGAATAADALLARFTITPRTDR